MRKLRLALMMVVVCIWAIFVTSTFGQGSLTPPGAPAPTMKTLQEIEPRIPITNAPFTISAAGSYYVTTNLTGQSGTNGITINADDITVDLNGFTLIGVAGSVDGIGVPSDHKNIVVRNGVVRNWGDEGVDFNYVRNGRISELCAFTNSGYGIFSGRCNVVKDCTARNNSSGIYAGYGSTISGCTAEENGAYGIQGLDNVSISGCVAENNTSDGIHLESSGIVRDCSAKDNGGDGIEAAHGAIVNNCVVTSNDGNGIYGDFGVTISGCRTHYNKGDGIKVDEDCMVINCSSKDDGYLGDGAGLHAVGANNRIEGNNAVNCDRGIDVDVSGNLIIRNSASDSGGGSNYVVVTGNSIGGIVDVSSGGFTNTNPWVNFEF